jgi:hypothetical protein
MKFREIVSREAGEEAIGTVHVSEAIQYRTMDRYY